MCMEEKIFGFRATLETGNQALAEPIGRAGERPSLDRRLLLSGVAFGIGTAVPSGFGITPAEVQLNDGDVICFGAGERFDVLHTPGHPAGGVCYALYDSVVDELFALPGATRKLVATIVHALAGFAARGCISQIHTSAMK
jgi:hypothetical protein